MITSWNTISRDRDRKILTLLKTTIISVWKTEPPYSKVKPFFSIKMISEEHKKLESSFHVHKNEAITKLENALWELKSIYTMYKQMNKTLSNDHMKSFLLQKTKSEE